jgi:tetratricopeptide (TPR) repeat protein
MIMIRNVLLVWLALQTVSPAVKQHWEAARRAESEKQFDLAVSEYRKVTESEPAFAAGFVSLGQALMENRDFGGAIAPLKHALELDASLAPAHQLLGYALLAQGYAGEAIPHLDQVHEYGALGIAQLETGQLAESVANLQRALQARPNDPDLLYYLGRAGGLLSKQSIDTLLATYPDSARAHQSMAENYFVLRRMTDAEKEYQQALKMTPNTPNLHLELGQVYAMSSNWAQAEEQFRAEAKLQPGNAEAAYRLGEALLEQGKAHPALVELERSDKLQPQMPETLYALGKAAAMEGKLDTAEKSWTNLLSIEKDTPLAAQAHFGLAGIYRRQGKSAEAAEQMKQFQALEDHSKPATESQ